MNLNDRDKELIEISKTLDNNNIVKMEKIVFAGKIIQLFVLAVICYLFRTSLLLVVVLFLLIVINFMFGLKHNKYQRELHAVIKKLTSPKEKGKKGSS